MNARDLHNNVKCSRALSPAAAITGNGTTNGEIIDTVGFGSLEFAFASGTLTDGTFTIKLQEGDDVNLSDAADVAAADLIGTAPTFLATEDDVVKKLGYRGSKRYVRPVLTQSGATSGGLICSVAIQGHAQTKPAA